MADEMYPNMEEAESPAGDETPESKSALIPKSIFGDREFKPGDTITLKIGAVYEDEYEASPASEEEPTETETKPSAEAELDMMAQGES